jgi:hypothetical protein
MTKKAFMKAYYTELLLVYNWTRGDEGIKKLEKFMKAVRLTITSGREHWNHQGKCVTAAWHAIGGKGIPTLKALRALPNE